MCPIGWWKNFNVVLLQILLSWDGIYWTVPSGVSGSISAGHLSGSSVVILLPFLWRLWEDINIRVGKHNYYSREITHHRDHPLQGDHHHRQKYWLKEEQPSRGNHPSQGITHQGVITHHKEITQHKGITHHKGSLITGEHPSQESLITEGTLIKGGSPFIGGSPNTRDHSSQGNAHYRGMLITSDSSFIWGHPSQEEQQSQGETFFTGEDHLSKGVHSL